MTHSRIWTPGFLLSVLSACSAASSPLLGDAGEDLPDARFVEDAGSVEGDGGTLPDGPRDSGTPLDGATDSRGPSDAKVDAPAVPGELSAADGDNAVRTAGAGEVVYRVEGKPGEHIGFELTFADKNAKADLGIERWTGSGTKKMYTTTGGLGIRTLAVYHATESVTYWARIKVSASFTGTLQVTRTPFKDGAQCESDCAKLLQLPIPNDPKVDGYEFNSATLVRYQFGRRDLVMFVRNAGIHMVKHGRNPFYPHDFSQWDGETPGTDTGSLRHLSHQRGKDVDLSLFSADGSTEWRSYCDTESVSGGVACKSGTARELDGLSNAGFFGLFYESGRITMMFLDKELIALVKPKALDAQNQGFFGSKYQPYFSDGKHLQHWPNHDDHVHVRVSEDAYPTKVQFLAVPTHAHDEDLEGP